MVTGNTLTQIAGGDAREGMHPGRIRIQSAGKSVTSLDLNLSVRSFELAEPRIVFGMYHHREHIPSFVRTDEWLAPIYRDMTSHGKTSVSFYGEGGEF